LMIADILVVHWHADSVPLAVVVDQN